MVKQKSDRRKARAAALATLKSRRQFETDGTSALDSYNAEIDNVYDDYDEEDYRRRVESERLKEDFVVDDGEFFGVLFCVVALFCVECMSRACDFKVT